MLLSWTTTSASDEESTRTIYVFVALCDNEHQGIFPVPPKLGNGDDPANNLYWGAMYGVKTEMRTQRRNEPPRHRLVTAHAFAPRLGFVFKAIYCSTIIERANALHTVFRSPYTAKNCGKITKIVCRSSSRLIAMQA
ncbi:MAG: hypothetical protein Kow0099_10580 [Candidatus Abyssubacteria bacterium]